MGELPLQQHGGRGGGGNRSNGDRNKRSPSLATDEEDLVPGLSGSVCAKIREDRGVSLNGNSVLLKEIPSTSVESSNSLLQKEALEGSTKRDDFYMHLCVHAVSRNSCRMCKNDAPLPKLQFKSVWREEWSNESGVRKLVWQKQQRVDKVRRRGPLDRVVFCKVDDSDEELLNAAEYGSSNDNDNGPNSHRNYSRQMMDNVFSMPLTPGNLKVELAFENYSMHQPKPKSMVTIQCLQMLRRDEYASHYQTVHCDLLGDGLQAQQLLRRCPLMSMGCSYSALGWTAGSQHGEITFSPILQTFGLKPKILSEPISHEVKTDSEKDMSSGLTAELSADKLPSCSLIIPNPLSIDASLNHQYSSPSTSSLRLFSCSREASPLPPANLYQAAPNLTCLPQEVLQYILSFLDGYSLCQVALTCEVLNLACQGLVKERGIVLHYWYRDTSVGEEEEAKSSNISKSENTKKKRNGAKSRWKTGKPCWVFSSNFGSIDHMRIKEDILNISNHLQTCQYYERSLTAEKFSYSPIPKKAILGDAKERYPYYSDYR